MCLSENKPLRLPPASHRRPPSSAASALARRAVSPLPPLVAHRPHTPAAPRIPSTVARHPRRGGLHQTPSAHPAGAHCPDLADLPTTSPRLYVLFCFCSLLAPWLNRRRSAQGNAVSSHVARFPATIFFDQLRSRMPKLPSHPSFQYARCSATSTAPPLSSLASQKKHLDG